MFQTNDAREAEHTHTHTHTHLLQCVDIQARQRELEVGSEIFVHIDAGSGRHGDGWYARLVQVHEESSETGRQVQQGALTHQRRAPVYLQLHAGRTSAQVTHHQSTLAVPAQVGQVNAGREGVEARHRVIVCVQPLTAITARLRRGGHDDTDSDRKQRKAIHEFISDQ